ncbi:MAG: EAL domain-containing protein [Alphaproteobacteria bacterium]|nr:EAL domain-containing protein [Alphaproteobacteria bacterium]MDX5414961.1 EAL domain-containing protein [Alphaproteobacteria bacterium]MDX5492144.1 EAL domain-containing protein [Alphaproteobacteria bacterium]
MYSSSFRLTNRDIDIAFDAGHLYLVCQPKLCLATGEALGAEAYIRWNHPDYGLLPPGLFLSFFERRERSGELTRFVARAAAGALATWQAAGQNWPLSINLSAPDLADMGLPGALDEIMAERGLDPASLILEVPEGAFARHGETAQRTLGDFRRLGFRTALDGGGAVIVPDDLLTREHFDEVKIGGAAIIQFSRRLKSTGLGFVGKRVALAASRGLEATAVGVEDATTLAALPALGFTAAQGAHICRPSAPAELFGWSAPHLLPEPEPEPVPAAEDVLELHDPLPDGIQAGDTIESVLELTDPIVEYSWEGADAMIPGEEVRGVAWRIDRVCLFPDRHLVALIRRKRVLPHMKKAEAKKPALKKAAAKPAIAAKGMAPEPKPVRRPPQRPMTKRAPAGLVTRPSLVQFALGF